MNNIPDNKGVAGYKGWMLADLVTLIGVVMAFLDRFRAIARWQPD